MNSRKIQLDKYAEFYLFAADKGFNKSQSVLNVHKRFGS